MPWCDRGDGSLTGALVFHDEWTDLINDLVNKNLVPAELAARHPPWLWSVW
jgi:hypothetical protein